LKPNFQSKKVAIVGGGAAGLEAARTSAIRGHQFTLLKRVVVLVAILFLEAPIPLKKKFVI
jgi:NADPH-dependent 2,4-dienoyl-CoA reductase/sulfur reductase-like enzyme